MTSSSNHPPRRWSSPRTALVALSALGLLLLAFQLNKVLTSSFRIELFGVEILEVTHLDDEAPAAETPAERPRRAPAPPAPAASDEAREVFVVVEQMPELIGGLASIQRAVRYPESAKQAGVEGRVIVQFIVDERGRVIEPTIVRGIGEGCDAEALRVVRQARFRPGTQRGTPVKVKMSLPLTFRLR